MEEEAQRGRGREGGEGGREGKEDGEVEAVCFKTAGR